MEETQALSSNGERQTFPDWSILIGRAAEGVSNILHAETHLLQINVGAALKAQIDYAVTTFAMVVALICARICFVTALILVLHQSFQWQLGLPWWEAFAIGGLLLLAQSVQLQGAAQPQRQTPLTILREHPQMTEPRGRGPRPGRNPSIGELR
jgi:hypothetical protein